MVKPLTLLAGAALACAPPVAAQLDTLLESAASMLSPTDVVVAVVRQIYLIIGWILARVVRGSIKLGDVLTGRFLQIGGRLHALT